MWRRGTVEQPQRADDASDKDEPEERRNIGSERSARHNAFMYSIIESCKMVRRNVEDYLKSLLNRLRTARDGDDLTCCLPCYLPA